VVGLKLNNNIGKEVSWRIPPQPSLLYSLWMGYPAPYYEFGQWSNLGDIGDYGMFEMQTQYLLTLDAHLRDTVFEDTFRNFQKWLCRLAKRVSVLDLLIKITDDLDVAKTTIIQNAQPYEEMFEYPLGSIGNKDGEPAWYEFLYWERMKDCSYPMLLGYKYLNDPKNDNEIKRRNDWRKS